MFVMRVRTAAVAAAVAGVAVLVLAAPASAAVEPYVWPHRAGHWPVVYVEDHTGNGPAWLVRHAVYRWGSGLRYGPCRVPAGCVRVYSRREGRNGYVGTEWPQTDGTRLLYVKIELNETYRPLGRRVTRQAAAHELGHALGLAHDHGGVMQSVDRGGAKITAYERRELARLYGVRS